MTQKQKYKISNGDKRCAPHITFDGMSCIQLHCLVDMARAYNDYHDDKQIKLNSKMETLNPERYKDYLIKQFEKSLGDTCTTQKCWTEQEFMTRLTERTQNEVLKYTFRPNGPEGKFEWLNTFNINDVMTQYEAKYKDFKYLGTVPMDFDSLPELGIADLQFKDLHSAGYNQVGIVFNLDESGQPGSHWVGLYGNIEKGNVYYFDSYGTPPEPRVRKLMRRIDRQCKEFTKKYEGKAGHNHVRHQYKNSECGVYSMNFIIRMLEGEGFDTICKSKTSDDEIHRYRKKYFVNA